MLLVQLIGLGASLRSIALSIIYTSTYRTVHSPHHCLLVTTRISIADLIGGTRGVSSGVPLRLGTFGCEKLHWNLLWIKYAKIWKLLKMYTWNVPFQISKYATGWGLGRQHRRLPRAANTLAPPLHITDNGQCFFTSACHNQRAFYCSDKTSC